MFVTINWPDRQALPIPENLYDPLVKHLLEGFESIEEARQFWNDIPTILIVLNADDDHHTVNCEPDELQNQLAFALAYPEYIVPLGSDYQLTLAISSDEGSGIYLLVHNECPLSGELADA
jgi:hypothetical protein